jgi:hypothetical protein
MEAMLVCILMRPPPPSLGATSRLSRLALCCGRWTLDALDGYFGLLTAVGGSLAPARCIRFDGCSGYQASPITLPARHMVRREPASCRRRRRGPQAAAANHRRRCPPSPPSLSVTSPRQSERAPAGPRRPFTPSPSPMPARGVPGCHAASARLPRPSTPAKSQLSSPGTTRDPPSAITAARQPFCT